MLSQALLADATPQAVKWAISSSFIGSLLTRERLPCISVPGSQSWSRAMLRTSPGARFPAGTLEVSTPSQGHKGLSGGGGGGGVQQQSAPQVSLVLGREGLGAFLAT